MTYSRVHSIGDFTYPYYFAKIKKANIISSIEMLRKFSFSPCKLMWLYQLNADILFKDNFFKILQVFLILRLFGKNVNRNFYATLGETANSKQHHLSREHSRANCL